jgi:hypothetical protein
LNGVQLTAVAKATEDFTLSNLEGGTFNKDVLDAWLRDNTALV